MKREILFRGRLPGGDWLYGVPLKERNGKVMMYTQDEAGYVAPATVGQFTGLTDQNGTRIFEGDIVSFEDAVADYEGYHDNVFINRAVIAYDEYRWAVCGDISTVTMADLVYKGEFDGEVIGNIWDNPELLKEDAT